MMTRESMLATVGATLLLGGGLLAGAVGRERPSPFGTRSATRSTVQPAAAVTLPAGTPVRIRLNQALGTNINRPGDRFDATLEAPLLADGRTVAPRGAAVSGLVREAQPSGRLKGQAVLILSIDSVEANGRRLSVATSSQKWQSATHKKRNLAWLGGGAGSGALIGGLAGGPVGLGIGAGAGAAAGLTGAAVTGRRQVRLPAETLVTFRLSREVTIQLAS